MPSLAEAEITNNLIKRILAREIHGPWHASERRELRHGKLQIKCDAHHSAVLVAIPRLRAHGKCFLRLDTRSARQSQPPMRTSFAPNLAA
jgi:hypothetical protein